MCVAAYVSHISDTVRASGCTALHMHSSVVLNSISPAALYSQGDLTVNQASAWLVTQTSAAHVPDHTMSCTCCCTAVSSHCSLHPESSLWPFLEGWWSIWVHDAPLPCGTRLQFSPSPDSRSLRCTLNPTASAPSSGVLAHICCTVQAGLHSSQPCGTVYC